MIWDAVYLALNIAACLLFGINLWQWIAGRAHQRRSVLMTVAFAALVSACYLGLVGPQQIPISWITVLQEGRSRINVDQVYGTGVHALENFHALLQLVAPPGAGVLRAAVRWNLWLALMSAAFFFALARHLIGSRVVAGAMTILYVASPVFVNMSLSEAPSLLLSIYFFMGVVAVAHLPATQAARPLATIPAWLLLADLTFLAAETRVEFGGVFLMCLAGVVARSVLPLILPRAWSPVAGVVWRLRWVVLAAPFAIARFLPPVDPTASYPVKALYATLTEPHGPSMLSVLSTFAMTAGCAVLVALGGAFLFMRPLKLPLFPLALVGLYSVYYHGAHGDYATFEAFRYVTYHYALCMVLALVGIVALKHWAATNAWPVWWPAATIASLLVVSALGPRPRTPGTAVTDIGVAPRWRDTVLLARNQQLEVRYLLALTEQEPECVYAARVLRDAPNTFEYVLMGAPVADKITVEDDPAAIEPALARAHLNPRCIRQYLGLDCSLMGTDGCAGQKAAYPRVESLRFKSRPYNELEEYGESIDAVELVVTRFKEQEGFTGGTPVSVETVMGPL